MDTKVSGRLPYNTPGKVLCSPFTAKETELGQVQVNHVFKVIQLTSAETTT